MGYDIKFQREAKAELDSSCEVYGPGFRLEILTWLSEIAAAVERKDYSLDVDVLEAAKGFLGGSPSSIRHSLNRWAEASYGAKLRAFITLLTKRCPPWELRAAEKRFIVIDTFPADVLAYYEIDHTKKVVVFRMFHGLPGQG